MYRRVHAEQQARAYRHGGGEPEYRAVELEMERRRGLWRQNGSNSHQRPLGDEQAGNAAHQSQQARLEQELPDHLTTARTEREPHGHLSAPCRRARQQQIGNVGTGDQQYDPRYGEQQQKGRARLFVNGALSLHARRQRNLLGPEAGHAVVAHSFLQRRFDLGDDRPVDGIDRPLRLLERCTCLEPREQICPVAPTVLEVIETGLHLTAHRDRHEDARCAAESRSVEAAGCNTDYRHLMAVDDHRLVDYTRVGAKAILPVVMAQHRYVVGANRLIVARHDQPAERRSDAEQREIRARNHHSLAVQRLPAIGKVGAECAMGGYACKRGR